VSSGVPADLRFASADSSDISGWPAAAAAAAAVPAADPGRATASAARAATALVSSGGPPPAASGAAAYPRIFTMPSSGGSTRCATGALLIVAPVLYLCWPRATLPDASEFSFTVQMFNLDFCWITPADVACGPQFCLVYPKATRAATLCSDCRPLSWSGRLTLHVLYGFCSAAALPGAGGQRVADDRAAACRAAAAGGHAPAGGALWRGRPAGMLPACEAHAGWPGSSAAAGHGPILGAPGLTAARFGGLVEAGPSPRGSSHVGVCGYGGAAAALRWLSSCCRGWDAGFRYTCRTWCCHPSRLAAVLGGPRPWG